MKIIVLVLSISMTVVTAAPRLRREGGWFGGRLNEHSPSFCRRLSPQLEEYCGYSHTYFFNGKGHHEKSFQDAEREFNDFIPLIDTQCSSYLGTLLCFYYFPQSNCNGFSADELSEPRNRIQVLPCKETCNYAKNDTCVSFAQTVNSNWTWPIQFQDCDQFPPSGGSCAYGKKISPFTKSQTTTPLPQPQTTISIPKISVVKGLATEEPDKEESEKCPKSETQCTFRQIARSKTFQVKNKYTFAIKAEIISGLQQGKFNVNVTENFDLQECSDGNDNVIPVEGQITTISVPCTKSSAELISIIESNRTVIIAGSSTAGGLVLDCSYHKPLLGYWQDKYNSRLSKWTLKYNNECTQ